MRFYGCLLILMLNALPVDSAEESIQRPLASFSAQEAHQGIAVDKQYVYAIGTREIGKYDKFTGEQVLHWKTNEAEPLIHLDSGVVVDGKLYCAHSNFPQIPMTSSVEVWDCETLTHIESHSFGIAWGSCTWIDRHDNAWWAMFAHYNNGQRGGYEFTNNRWTTLVRFNDEWQPQESWVFPDQVLERFGNYSCSGGSWKDGLLYCSGHDRAELYIMKLPKAGSILELVNILPFTNEGQGIAFDHARPEHILYGIRRSQKEVFWEKIRKVE